MLDDMVNMFDEVRKKVEDGGDVVADPSDPSDPYQRGTLILCHVCSCRHGVGFVSHGWIFGGA